MKDFCSSRPCHFLPCPILPSSWINGQFKVPKRNGKHTITDRTIHIFISFHVFMDWLIFLPCYIGNSSKTRVIGSSLLDCVSPAPSVGGNKCLKTCMITSSEAPDNWTSLSRVSLYPAMQAIVAFYYYLKLTLPVFPPPIFFSLTTKRSNI